MSSSDGAVATVSSTGLVRTAGAGTTQVSASVEGVTGLGYGEREQPGALARRRGPDAVTGNATYLGMTAGNTHSCGVTSTGAVQCWGSLQWGQLGIGVPGYVSTPTPVQGSISFSRVVRQ